MIVKSCGFLTHAPLRFKFGWDEEDEQCIALKQVILQQIQLLRYEGCNSFYVVPDSGAGFLKHRSIQRYCFHRKRAGNRVHLDFQPKLFCQFVLSHQASLPAAGEEINAADEERHIACEGVAQPKAHDAHIQHKTHKHGQTDPADNAVQQANDQI